MKNSSNKNPVEQTIHSYNMMAEEYCKITSQKGDRDFQEKMMDITFNYIRHNKEGLPRLIDLGCGDGRDSYYIYSKGFDVVGIDLSRSMIELAREKYPKIAFFKEDMRDTVFPDNTFHAAWASSSIINMPKSDLSKIESEVYRILEPDGIFAFSVKIGNKEGFEDGDIIKDYPRYFSYYTLSELKDRLNLFEVIDSKEYPGELFESEFLYCWAKKTR